MYYATACLRKVARETDSVILFHSANGKDSIALLDLCYPYFRRVVCVYMYMVADLQHINNYINYAKQKYKGTEFYQVPHFVLSQYARDGFLGYRKDVTQRVYGLRDITKMAKLNYGIDWAIFGFKQSDSLNRRLMLRGYEDEMICRASNNIYPLSKYKNSDVLAYIKNKKLIPPLSYGKGQSQGVDVMGLGFLLFCKMNWPEDYKKVIATFPMAERIVFEYEYSLKNGEK